jgi:hypothetical protein
MKLKIKKRLEICFTHVGDSESMEEPGKNHVASFIRTAEHNIDYKKIKKEQVLRICIIFGSRNRITEKLDPDPDQTKLKNFRGSKWSHGGPWTLTMVARRIKMEGAVENLLTSGRRFSSLLTRTGSALKRKVGSDIAAG